MHDKWLWWKYVDAEVERQQAVDEGKDLSGINKEVNELCSKEMLEDDNYQEQLNLLMDEIQELKPRSDYSYEEPSLLNEIKTCRPDGPRTITENISEKVMADKIHGAWLGRCVGCLLGKPVEKWLTKSIWPMLEDAGLDFLTDYFWKLGISDQNISKNVPGFTGFIEYDHMPIDDDTNYTITGMEIIRKYGFDFSPIDVSQFWMQNIPILATCTAERVAYRNFVNQITPPQSAVVRNPYREWIGSQIRGDIFGYISGGRPEYAAELAWRDGSISHIKNGIYGEMWVAAMLAAAASENNIKDIITIGLSEIPRNSRLAENIISIIELYEHGSNYEDAINQVHSQWNEESPHDWCHTISNAQIVAISLLWSDGDFEKAITQAVWPGFDTDCNGATVGSIMGMLKGEAALPKKWTSPLNDTIFTSVAGYSKTSISGTAKIMYDLYKKALP